MTISAKLKMTKSNSEIRKIFEFFQLKKISNLKMIEKALYVKKC